MLKKVIFIISLSSLFILSLFTICFSMTTEYGAMTVQCPDTVKIGTPLDVYVTLHNRTEITLIVTKLLVSLTGNVGNSITGIGFFGPFSRNVDWTIPPNNTITELIRIIDKVPASLAGKVSAAFVSVTSPDYKIEYGTEFCMVNVVK